jgi:large subunit ribosomal protein L40e
MQLFVKRLSGGTLVLDVSPDDSVAHLKALVQREEGVPAGEQCLVFGGRALANNAATMRECTLEAASTLHLTLRLRGGMADEFERVNPITQKVLDGVLSRRSMGTVYKWLKYEDLDPSDILSWKKSIQGLNSKGQIKWDFTMPAHKRFQSLSKSLTRVAIMPDRWIAKERDPSMCNFIFEDRNGVRWICNNQRAKHEVTGKLLDKCGWHSAECVGKHNDHSRPAVEFPNADGLCTAHYFAKHTDEPPRVPFLDTPGIAILNAAHFKSHMKLARLNEDHESMGEMSDEDMTYDDSTTCVVAVAVAVAAAAAAVVIVVVAALCLAQRGALAVRWGARRLLVC